MTATTRRLLRAALVPVAASLVLSACGSSDDSNDSSAASADGSFSVSTDDCTDPSVVTKKITDTISLGYSAPLSGPVAGVAELAIEGYKARIAEANAAGGIDGVKIDIKYLDDAFQPDKAKANATQFIEKDKVDLLSTFGSGPLGAMADDAAAACVPFMYPSSSDDTYRKIEDYPWIVEYLPSASSETDFLVKYIQSKVTNPAEADAFEASAKAAGLTITKVADDTDPTAAATTLKSAGVDVVYHAGVVGSCGAFDGARERVDYHPTLVVAASNCADATEYVSAGAGSDGVTIAKYLEDTSDPALATNPNVVNYHKVVAGVKDPDNTVTQSGYMQADLLVNTLTQAAKSSSGLTRESIIQAARDQDYDSPLLIDGITWKATATRPAGVSGFQAVAWNAKEKKFVVSGDVIAID